MLSREVLKEVLVRTELTNTEKMLCCLGADPLQAKKIDEIRQTAVACGLRAATKWNISSILASAKGLAIRTDVGWELTASGKLRIVELAGETLPSVSVLVVSGLQKQLPSISNDATRSFVEEAIKCLELKLFRSAIVTAWVGAVAVLQDEIVGKHLATFNAEALKRDSKWRAAVNADDLSRMKEFDFLQILPAISVVGKSVKDELEVCLKLRNGCGHPNSLVVGEHKASAHVETLIQNVFARF